MSRLLICLALSAAGCAGGDDSPAGKPRTGPPVVKSEHSGGYPIKILCTTGMVADLVKRVGGGHVEVTAMMGPEVDPHLFKPQPSDLRALRKADAVFYSGLHLEGKMADVLAKLEGEKPVYPVAEYLPESMILKAGEGAYDPHVWFDVGLWARCIETVREVLSRYDPENAGDYEASAAKYQSELQRLHQWAARRIASIPEKQRVLITAHDAFRYFGRVYGMEVRGIQGISTESEASLKETRELADFIAERKIKAVFVETSVPKRAMEKLRQDCADRGHEVAVGGKLFSDAMGAAGTPLGTYVGMVRHNVNAIVDALK